MSVRNDSGSNVARAVGLAFSYFMLQGTLLQCACGPDSKPNIVIFLADDLGYGDLGCYGHPYSTTPNIDALANEGLKFTDFHSASSICSPSRAALLTGRYHTRSGVYGTESSGVFIPNSIGGLPLNETTIAEYVKQAGYSTAMVGKWHLGVGLDGKYLPTHQGFDYYLGIPYSHNMAPPCPMSICFYPNISCYDNEPSREDCERRGPPFPPCPLYENTTIIDQPTDYLTLYDKYVSAATNYIKRETANGKPFLLYMAFNHPHQPQYAGETFTKSSIRGRYGDALNEMDSLVGQIMTALTEAAVDKNTFVFFASDNGPALSEEVRGGTPDLLKCGKGTTYEGGHRVPGIAWWPGIIKPGKTTELASTLDLLPTILKLVNVEAKEGVTLDGYDMGPILFEGKESLRDRVYYHYPILTKEDWIYAVRYRQYKAHFITQGTDKSTDLYPDSDCHPSDKIVQDPPLLFDLHLDPSEVYTLTPNDPDYNQTMSIISKMKDQFNADMVWGESQIDRGNDIPLMPCACPGCTPFPSCCHT